MTTKKPFWQSTSGIVIGCLSLVALLLLCVCVGLVALVASGGMDQFTGTTTKASIIADAVMAKGVQAGTFAPIEVTFAFPANQSIFHAVVTIKDAPKDTTVGAIWLTDAGQRMGEYEIKTEGSRNLDFTFQPNGGKLPPGNYKVEIRVNGTPDRSMNFTVQEAAAVAPTTTRIVFSTSASSSVASSAQPKPSGYVNSVTMAEGTQGANRDPLNPTTVFGPNSTFHAVVRTQNAPANTRFKSAWYVVDAGTVVKPNTLIDETEITTDGTRNIDFSLAPTASWPPGSYRVEILVNGVLDTVRTFSVK